MEKAYFLQVEGQKIFIFWVRATSYREACEKLDLRIEEGLGPDDWTAYEKTTGTEVYLTEFDGIKGEITYPGQLTGLVLASLLQGPE